jgi:ABC-type proline/glycine betaine transport system permease subunit
MSIFLENFHVHKIIIWERKKELKAATTPFISLLNSLPGITVIHIALEQVNVPVSTGHRETISQLFLYGNYLL